MQPQGLPTNAILGGAQALGQESVGGYHHGVGGSAEHRISISPAQSSHVRKFHCGMMRDSSFSVAPLNRS